MMTGGDLFRRRVTGSVKTAMERVPQTFVRVGNEWAERDYLPYVELTSPEDTGDYKSKHEVEVTPKQITLKNTADHAFTVEYGNSNHFPHMTITTAEDKTRPKLTARLRDAIKKELT